MAITLISFVILALTTYEVRTTEMATVKCGTTTRQLFTPRISMGEKTDRGAWPFLTALFKVKEKEEPFFFCGGSLISSRHVLTAAHCIQGKGIAKKLLPGNINVVLGAYNLTSKTEIGVQQRDVQEIYVHPEWNVYSDKYDADVAILHLNEVVLFTDYIRPVCIPTNDTVIDGVEGSIVGWGLTENGSQPNKEFIKRAAVTVLNSVYCLTKYPGVAGISSMRTFCGEGNNGNANRGDSGGGFYAENEEYVYELRGIISSLNSDASGYVGPGFVVVYTNVGIFKNWIDDTVKESDDDNDCKKRVSCSTIGIDSERNGIKCDVDLIIKLSDQNCAIIFDELPNANVTSLIIWGELEALPDLSDAYRAFKNIAYLGFGFIKIKEVKRNKLTPLRKVSWLNFWGNEISALDADTFDDLLEIDKLVLADNRLKIVHRDLFKELRKVTEIYLQQNQLEVLPDGLFRNNQELKNIYVGENNLKAIATDFRNLPKLVAIDFRGNQCISEWCAVSTFCGRNSKAEMQTKIWNKCNIST